MGRIRTTAPQVAVVVTAVMTRITSVRMRLYLERPSAVVARHESQSGRSCSCEKMISEKLELNTVTFNILIAALSEGGIPKSITTKDDLLWEKALAVYRVMKSKHAPTSVSPNRKTYNILICCLLANLQPMFAESLLIDMRKAGFVPNVDLYTMTVWSYEQCCGNPIKPMGFLEYMREMGYDFYEIKALDEAFKNGVKVLNRIGRGFLSECVDGLFYAMSDELLDFDNDGDYQLIYSERM